MTILDLVEKVKSGDYPDVERPQGERILVMDDSLITNYSLILAHCLLNGIPEETAQAVYPLRAELYDNIITAINTTRNGRINRLVGIIDKLCENSMGDKECWPKKREANNICQWAADYFAWTDETRREFYGFTNPEAENDGKSMDEDELKKEEE